MFTSGEGLYKHQTEHCEHGYTWISCDREFENLTRCQTHMANHVSRFGACSPHETPSQRQHTMLWCRLLYRQKPWEQDVQIIVGAGHLEDKIDTHC